MGSFLTDQKSTNYQKLWLRSNARLNTIKTSSDSQCKNDYTRELCNVKHLRKETNLEMRKKKYLENHLSHTQLLTTVNFCIREV